MTVAPTRLYQLLGVTLPPSPFELAKLLDMQLAYCELRYFNVSKVSEGLAHGGFLSDNVSFKPQIFGRPHPPHRIMMRENE